MSDIVAIRAALDVVLIEAAGVTFADLDLRRGEDALLFEVASEMAYAHLQLRESARDLARELVDQADSALSAPLHTITASGRAHRHDEAVAVVGALRRPLRAAARLRLRVLPAASLVP